MSKRIVHFTAYIRPHGKTERRSWVLDVPEQSKELVEQKLADINKAELTFTFEDLGNGTSNICLEQKGRKDYDSRIARTNPKDIKERVVQMIVSFDIAAFDRLNLLKDNG